MSFDPKTNKFPYPTETDRHYLEVHKDRRIVFDADVLKEVGLFED